MTKEQAIEILEGLKKSNEACIKSSKIEDTPFTTIWKRQNEAIETVLFMLEEKDKTIDLMAETINNHDIDEDICKQMGQKEDCNEFEDKEKCKDCIKQYFENKAKERR